jgi:hypothetical protein
VVEGIHGAGGAGEGAVVMRWEWNARMVNGWVRDEQNLCWISTRKRLAFLRDPDPRPDDTPA